MKTVSKPEAACIGADPEIFFPVGEIGSANLLQIEEAKTYCRRCPIKRGCLEDALIRGTQYGVWGGTSEADRRNLLRRRGLGVGVKDAKARTDLASKMASQVGR